MISHTIGPPATASHRTSTRWMLGGGIVAGPLFLVVSTLQALTRDGFDITKVAFSSLSLGEHGWIQITNFITAGLLCTGAAIALRRCTSTGPASTWGPRLFVIFGIGQIAAGTFTQDPAMGFPPGTPDGMPESFTWHGILHVISAPVAFLAAAIGVAVFARRFAAAGDRRWRIYSIATAILGPAVAVPPETTSAGTRLAVATGIVYLWIALYALRLLRQPVGTTMIDSATGDLVLHPIGVVDSPIKHPKDAPLQGDESGGESWIRLERHALRGATELTVGDTILVLTWLHAASRDVIAVHPRADPTRPLTGVFSTRSEHRPNPIGLHEVTILRAQPDRILVGGLEAINGTPVVDIKPLLGPKGSR